MTANMGKNELLRGFGCDMIVVLVSFQKKLICQDFSLKTSLEMTEKALKRGKNIQRAANCLGEKNTLLVRGAWPGLDPGKSHSIHLFF